MLNVSELVLYYVLSASITIGLFSVAHTQRCMINQFAGPSC